MDDRLRFVSIRYIDHVRTIPCVGYVKSYSNANAQTCHDPCDNCLDSCTNNYSNNLGRCRADEGCQGAIRNDCVFRRRSNAR